MFSLLLPAIHMQLALSQLPSQFGLHLRLQQVWRETQHSIRLQLQTASFLSGWQACEETMQLYL